MQNHIGVDKFSSLIIHLINPASDLGYKLGYSNKKSLPAQSLEGPNLLERATRFELATHGLGSRYSTTELRPHPICICFTLFLGNYIIFYQFLATQFTKILW